MSTQHQVGHTMKLGKVTVTYQGKGPDGEDVWASNVFDHIPADFPPQSKRWSKRT